MSTHSVEDIKSESNRLRGSLLESLADPVTGALRESDQTLICLLYTSPSPRDS